MIARRNILLLPLFAAGCSDGPSARSYPLPNYSYLTLLRLSVASLEINDRSPPAATDAVTSLAPLRPADALKQMAHDRLAASGTTGRAVFVVDQAWVRRAGGGLDGRMAVRLDIFTGGDTPAAGAEAQVARRRTSNDTSEDSRGVLYDFVIQMMDDMNVEFEFQVRRSLKAYLQDTALAVPLPPPVQSQDLAPPPPPLTGVLRHPQ